jgi:hypothetical protein
VRQNQISAGHRLPWGLYASFPNKEVHKYNPTMKNVGLQGVHIECRPAQYAGHFKVNVM